MAKIKLGGDAIVALLIIIIFVLINGCIQDKQAAAGAPESQMTPTSTQTPLPKTTIERVSNELNMLNEKGWSRLASDLSRPRATTLLWYHLKKIIGFEPKVVFGNPDKLNTTIAIPVKLGGESTFPKISIKSVDYYIIDPVTPAIIGEFEYGYMYDDPGSVAPGFFNNFRLNTDDNAIVEQWMAETGVDLYYTDFPGK